MDTLIKAAKTLAVIFSLYTISFDTVNHGVSYFTAVVILWYFLFGLLYKAGKSIKDEDIRG